VHKSSIYLPDALKRSLADLAARTGHSEADLIRQAIERQVSLSEASAAEAAPASAPLAIGRPACVGVGVGPGDPGLITERGRAVLAVADRTIVASTDIRSISRAEMIVAAIAPTATVVRVPFTIAPDASARQASVRAVADAVLASVDAGELAAIALLGDPSQWTIFPEVAALVAADRPDVPISAVPGITAYQAIAGASCLTLGRAGAPLLVTDDPASLEDWLAEATAGVVLYKASTDGQTVREAAASAGREAIIGDLVGLPSQRLRPVAEAPDGPLSYLAAIVFPAPRSPASTT